VPFALLLSTPSEEDMASGWAIKVEILVRLRSAAGVPLWVKFAILGPFVVHTAKSTAGNRGVCRTKNKGFTL